MSSSNISSEQLQKERKKNLAHHLCTHIQVTALLILKMTSKPAGSEDLYNAFTYDIDVKVHRCAIELEDSALLAKLEPGDTIALEAE